MYSNTRTPIYKLIIDGMPISRNNSYVVGYSCLTCGMKNEITLNLFMRKVNKNGKNCTGCVNKVPEKSEAQSAFMKENSKKIITGNYVKEKLVGIKSLTLNDHLDMSLKSWNEEDEEFKTQYFLRHLTTDDFERIRHLILGINNSKITDLSEWKYEPIYRVWNQTRYTPMLINFKTSTIEKPLYVQFKCENCGIHFSHRDIEIVKNKIKIMCNECSFTNRTFRIRTMILNNGSKIAWQSLQEKRFIEWCQTNNIKIQNGPKIPYTFNEITREYRVDFELPELKILIELKDNHCWYKQQVASGKQGSKELAAKTWCSNNNYRYEIIFPKTIQLFKHVLLRLCKI